MVNADNAAWLSDVSVCIIGWVLRDLYIVCSESATETITMVFKPCYIYLKNLQKMMIMIHHNSKHDTILVMTSYELLKQTAIVSTSKLAD